MTSEPTSTSGPGSASPPGPRLNITAAGAESPPEPELKGLRSVRFRRPKTPASDRRPTGETGGEPPTEVRIVVELKPPAPVQELRRDEAPPGRETLEQPPSNPVPSTAPVRPISPISPLGPRREHDQTTPIRARMLNEFVYCQRFFYYEFVEGVFVESANIVRGQAIHQRVDSGNGAMPKASKKPTAGKGGGGAEKSGTGAEAQTKEGGSAAAAATEAAPTAEPEVIHSRSVQMGSERLGVVAKMDLVEARAGQAGPAPGETGDLLSVLEVCPVDYKAGGAGLHPFNFDAPRLRGARLRIRPHAIPCRGSCSRYYLNFLRKANPSRQSASPQDQLFTVGSTMKRIYFADLDLYVPVAAVEHAS